MRYNKKYIKQIIENPLPPLPEDERIYFNVPYMARDFAKCAHCSFDKDKKLWFTGCLNTYLRSLVRLYGINDATSEKARQLLQQQFNKECGLYE